MNNTAGSTTMSGGGTATTMSGGNANTGTTNNNGDLSALLPIFTELVALTNSIVGGESPTNLKQQVAAAAASTTAAASSGTNNNNAPVFMGGKFVTPSSSGGNQGGGGGGGAAGTKLSPESLKKVAALTASMQRGGDQQAQNQQGGGGGVSMFSIFGDPRNNAAGSGNNNNNNNAPNVPPIPPPPGGWPAGAAPAAAAAAAMAAFATSMGDVDGTGSQCSGQSGGNGFPTPPQTTGNAEVDSAAWLDYYDKCLRARGVKGGIAEFEAFAQLSNQGAAVTAAMQAQAAAAAAQNNNNNGKDDSEDNSLPDGFEFDGVDRTTWGKNNDDGIRVRGMTEEERQRIETERLALEAAEAEEREKKAAKKRDKKSRQKERAKKEAEEKATAAAIKKREKGITSWRSRVVGACSGTGDAKKMDILVGESPYKNYVYDPNIDVQLVQGNRSLKQCQEEYLLIQLGWFLPNCLQKYQSSSSSTATTATAQPFSNNQAREKLLKYIISQSLDVILHQSPNDGHDHHLLVNLINHHKNAIHLAAYNNDVNFIEWVINSQKSSSEQGKRLSSDGDSLFMEHLEGLCSDGGWSPLHYATAGGATNVVELLLAEGVNVTTRTNRSLTCFNR